MNRPTRGLVAALACVAAACGPNWAITNYPTNEALFRASLLELQHGHSDNALAGFEKLTTDLPVRDTLLPRSYWYLALTHKDRSEYLLESFSDDSLAPQAALEAARSYWKLWPKPSLDPTYGERALEAYTTVLALYPDKPAGDTATKEVAKLEGWFATKAYEAGLFYFRNGCPDCAIIYFKEVLARWPNSPRTRDALLRLAESYKQIKWKEDVSETCARLRESFPTDREVAIVCKGVPATGPAVPLPKPPPALPR